MTGAAPLPGTIAALGAALRRREISSRDVTRACLERAVTLQPVLNAFLRMDADHALERAALLDEETAHGRCRGPLHGVPVAHKDVFYRRGEIATGGSPLRRTEVADRTAVVLERLDDAGAVTLGTLNLAEFALGPTGHNRTFGDCRNPWDPERISGGSSSGSGAAVAAGLVYAALGTDTGGSVRIPAALCGVVGLKPTYDAVSRRGVMPLAPSLDTVGSIARTAEDCRVLHDAVAGTVRDGTPSTTDDLIGLRIGVFEHDDGDGLTTAAAECLERSLARLRWLGASVEVLPTPDLRVLDRAATVVLASEAASHHAPWMQAHPGEYDPTVRDRIVAGLSVPAVDYLDALRGRGRALAAFETAVFRRVDVLHLPSVPFVAPTLAAAFDGSGSERPPVVRALTRHTRWLNYLGLPALAVPARRGGERGDGDLPIGCQLVAPPWGEPELFRIALALDAGEPPGTPTVVA